jgi:hypothetical protein
MTKNIFVDLNVYASSRPKYSSPKWWSTLKFFDLNTFSEKKLFCHLVMNEWLLLPTSADEEVAPRTVEAIASGTNVLDSLSLQVSKMIIRGHM